MEDAPRISVAGDPKYSADIPDRTPIEIDRAVAALAGRQHGMVARYQLLELGMTEAMIKTRLRHGALHRLHRGVFASGRRLITTESRWMAAVLAFGPQAVLSHRSAATTSRRRSWRSSTASSCPGRA
jgi:hypothetical protein